MRKGPSILIGSLVLLAAVVILAVPNLTQAFQSFRCGTKLVMVGDTKGDILSKCGSPTTKAKGTMGTGGGEVWTYNRGSTKRVAILRFTGPKVTAIETSMYGYAGS